MSEYTLNPRPQWLARGAWSPLLALVAVLSGGMSANSASAQMMTARTLDRVKQATVRVYVTDAGVERRSAGLVVKLDKTSAFVVTSALSVAIAVDPKDSEERGEPVPPKVAIRGANSDERLEATLWGVDMERDLALLKIAADKSHFGSLDPGPAPARLTETMSVYSFGFTAEGDEANVTVAVKRGAVVSIRRSAPDENGWIRVDAVPSEGHVGGPVVDSSGRLVGICRQAVKDDRETVLTPRGDVKSFVEVALKGQLPKLATMKATTRKVAATDEPNAPKMTEPKNLLGGVRLLNASWGVLVEGGEPLLDTVDVLDTVAKLLEEGTVFEVEERLFPERTTRLRLALHL